MPPERTVAEIVEDMLIDAFPCACVPYESNEQHVQGVYAGDCFTLLRHRVRPIIAEAVKAERTRAEAAERERDDLRARLEEALK